MAAGETAARAHDRSGNDVLRRLRSGTAREHEDVEHTLALLDPGLERSRLTDVLDRMHGFWVAAEAGLDRWGSQYPQDAAAVDWPRRRRAGLFAADLAALGGTPTGDEPHLPAVNGTDAALGRLYVLEGSTLGGVVIDRHLASLPQVADVRLRAFTPYGSETGAMWAAFRRVTRARVDAGGDADAMIDSARGTFRALAAWCRPAASAQALPA
ncbi:heme oxygenase [Blastococcus colisei]|uniref:Heme oxygenase n=1 Tax=Blastococcus colisei TaxID=1564162 RepID=A0A543PJF2_9ACTN|nr:biliverdin-producing heme oxygenase [Blastococcus colisei]TQN44188.1 heme oxygenase [Blastococcus colisei]